MTDSGQTIVPAAGSNLQFDRVEYAEERPPEALTCGFCKVALANTYYEVAGRQACGGCAAQAKASTGRRGAGPFLKAAGLGLGAAAIGSGIYYAVRAATGYEFGLIAIVVGVLVGRAVKRGGGGRGGPLYQGLAMFLTYLAIASTYLPLVIQAAKDHQTDEAKPAASAPAASQPLPASQQALPAGSAASAPQGAAAARPAEAVQPAPRAAEEEEKVTPLRFLGALAALLGLVLALPFLAGFKNVIGILIIGFALFEAWKINRGVQLVITGPYRIGNVPEAALR